MKKDAEYPPRDSAGRGTARRVVEGRRRSRLSIAQKFRAARGPSTAFGGPPPRQKPGRKKEQGFTLVEMMVVLVIIGLLATVVIINVMPAVDQAARTRVQADLSTLEEAIDIYHLQNGMRYPTSQEGLAVLAPNYIRRLPNDPWGTPYVYVSPGPNGAPYRIASLGADKREGGSGENADITN